MNTPETQQQPAPAVASSALLGVRRTKEPMKRKRNESDFDLNMRQINRNLDITFRLIKFGLLPIVALNIIIMMYKLYTR